MSKTLAAIAALPYVMHVDDEREDGNSIIVTLQEGYVWSDEPDCGVRGFDNVQAARAGTTRSAVMAAKPTTSPISQK